jgi:hypothetical protein
VKERARTTLGVGAAALLGGVLGIAWWIWHRRTASKPAVSLYRTRIAFLAAGLLVIAVGAVSRLVFAIEATPTCAPPNRVRIATSDDLTPSLVVQKAATWPETGLGMLYATADDARVCWSLSANYYVAVRAGNPVAARAVDLGDVLLSPRVSFTRAQLQNLATHEARHRTQWAVLTVAAGPLAFPVLYGIDDFFFPGARNHFERLAGLQEGGYTHEGWWPVLGAAQIVVLVVLAAVGGALVVRRRATRRRDDAPEPGTGPGRSAPPPQAENPVRQGPGP